LVTRMISASGFRLKAAVGMIQLLYLIQRLLLFHRKPLLMVAR